MISPDERRFIELLKESGFVRIELINKETTLTIRGDKIFAHDMALAYQSLVLREEKKRNYGYRIKNH